MLFIYRLIRGASNNTRTTESQIQYGLCPVPEIQSSMGLPPYHEEFLVRGSLGPLEFHCPLVSPTIGNGLKYTIKSFLKLTSF